MESQPIWEPKPFTFDPSPFSSSSPVPPFSFSFKPASPVKNAAADFKSGSHFSGTPVTTSFCAGSLFGSNPAAPVQNAAGVFSSGCGFLGNPVTVSSTPWLSSSTTSFSTGSDCASQNQSPSLPRKHIKTRKKLTNSYDEKVSVNGFLPKSTIFDSQLKNKDPTEIQKPKTEPIENSPLPIILISRILKEIPQSPHFLQLHGFSETTKSNLEAAWDRTFEETVDQIHELRAFEFWVGARRIWKTIEELERCGYSVFLLRKRVVELGNVMVKKMRSEREIGELRERAEERRMEKSRIESVIRNLVAQARREEEKMVATLVEVAHKEMGLPEIENQIADLAIQPLKV